MGALCCKEEAVDFNDEVDLSHFALLRSVGKGAFGKVRVVQHKGSKRLFALKYINKAKCIRMRAVENIISERRLLELIHHDFVVNLRYAFQDDENLFMVIDLMLGGDLRFHLDRMGPFPEDYVRFYAAEIALALRYLHRKHIVHRDLKPDNILLNEHGHAHLTDFNIAVRFSNEKPLTSIAGSMAYMAPEILMKRGYSASVDWWSLGVVCYELLVGKRPFRAKSNEALQQAIMHDAIEFPDDAVLSSDAKDFVHGLMTRDISHRLGYTSNGFRRLQAHPWFKDYEWDKLEAKQASPPFVPDLLLSYTGHILLPILFEQHQDKRANFDPTHELEEILLEDNPLKAKKRAPKRSGSNTNIKSQQSNDLLPEASPEQQIMEDKFLPFDYTKKPDSSPSIDKRKPSNALQEKCEAPLAAGQQHDEKYTSISGSSPNATSSIDDAHSERVLIPSSSSNNKDNNPRMTLGTSSSLPPPSSAPPPLPSSLPPTPR
ncbi:kinase-like domain-containing protein [Zychaea mexicana]|uniref:kinase-like domain-containing protein n=1 Tax=Zychaea mexicana TaxID=64656 RepID=UPI0022FE535E|nr:kinase-like domain-containing protein [Zychaea mexicana]KAI9498645.1 kinase-like domain-containing protein [Zychaea mexicana]